MIRKNFCTAFVLWLVSMLSHQLSAFSTEKINITAGGLERDRYEYWKNIFDYNDERLDERNYFRIKTSLWTQYEFDKTASIYVRMTNENKAYMYYGQEPGFAGKKHYAYNINEVVFDNIYIDVPKLGGSFIDVRIGRQDFVGMYGENFIFCDGTPLDGSRTYYFNAVKAALHADKENTFDIIYIYNPCYDKFMPIINEVKSSQPLNYTDETAFAVYHKSSSLKNISLEDYYIFKKENPGGPKMTAKKTLLNTFGSYAKVFYSPWTFRGQFAYQFGYYGTSTRRGIGTTTFIDRNITEVPFWKPEVSTGFIFLSGDNPKTDENEGWDPLFSRAPWMSELYNLSYNTESGMAYWTNLVMWRTSLVLKPMEKLKISLFYNYLRADQNVKSAGNIFSGHGKERGHLPQGRVDFTFNKNISAYVIAEYLAPGDFYVQDDGAIFVRAELMIKF